MSNRSNLIRSLDGFALALASPRTAFSSVRARLSSSPPKFPQIINLNTNDRCNFACPMCSVGQARDSRLADHRPDMDISIATKVIDEAAPYGSIIDLWGGEPSLYKPLPDLLSYASKKRLPTIMTTNGWLLGKQAESLVRSGLKILVVSLDGWDEPSSYARGFVPNSFQAILDGVAAVREARVRHILPQLRINTVITKHNFLDLERILDRVAEMQVRNWIICHYMFVNDGAKNAIDEFRHQTGIGEQFSAHHIENKRYFDAQEVQQLKKVLERVRGKAASLGIHVHHKWDTDVEKYYAGHAPSKRSNCSFPWNRIAVQPDGRLSLCVDGYSVGNVRTTTIREAWEGERRRYLCSKLEQNGMIPLCFRCCGIVHDIEFDKGSALPAGKDHTFQILQ
jgi:MoaA/NifB/PqqE/SkfB family radical SAM enzyme